MQEVDIPDIFDVLEGGEDESAVKYLLGFGGGDGSGGSGSTAVAPISVPVGVSSMSMRAGTSPSSSSSSKLDGGNGEEVRRGPGGRLVRKRDTSGLRAIYACNCCSKAFTTKFNLRRHINLHCNISKEAGVPLQGPPSAHFVSKKSSGSKIVSPLQPAAPGTGVLPVIKKAPTVVAATTTSASPKPISGAQLVSTAPLLKLTPSGPPTQAPSFSLSPNPVGASTGCSSGSATVKVLQDLKGGISHGNNSLTPISLSSTCPRLSAGGLVITATSAPSAMSSTASVTSSSSAVSTAEAVTMPSKVISMLPNSIVASTSTAVTNLPSFTVSVAVAPGASSPVSHISPVGDAIPKTIYLSSSANNANGPATDSFDGGCLSVASPAPALPMETDSSTTKCIEFIVAKIPSPPPPPPPLPESTSLSRNSRPRKSRVIAFPEGWVRKAVWANEEYSVFYFNRNGKKFASLGEVVEYFDRLDRDVDESLFDFLPTRQEVDDIRESRRRDRKSDLEAAQSRSLLSLI